MDQGWRLGPHWYVPDAAGGEAAGSRWAVVRRDGEGPRNLLQVWDRPPERVLDTLKEEFLQRFSRAEALDPGACHLGFDPAKAWCLQELGGTPLGRLWIQADRAGRSQLKARIAAALAGARAPRLLVPEAVGLEPGRVLAPRLLGAEQGGLDAARDALLDQLEQARIPEGADGGERPWDEPPEFADGSRLPLRGRMRELTYVKSLMLGLTAAIPMERVMLLQGEEGLGHDRLCDWAAAAAETEGIWVANLDIYPGEAAGRLLERVVAELIAGLEPDLYAALPAVARALSRRMATFAFLRGGRRAGAGEGGVEPEEVAAALEAVAFAQSRHPRMVLIRSLERANADIPRLLKELVAGSAIPWVLSARDPGLGPEARACLAALNRDPATAAVILDRLDDGQIRAVLGDLLGPHDLPPGVLDDLCAAALGNPGLLQKTLELAHAQGCIHSQSGRWACVPWGPALELPEDLGAGLLLGRLHRLHPAARAAVGCLALADEPLELAILGRVLGLDGDAAEEALHPAVNAKLALVADGFARIQGPSVRELVLAELPAPELRASAQALLKLLAGKARPLLEVRLQAFALAREAALAQVLATVEQAQTGPLEAERIVQEALKLGPDQIQQARLFEFQADAWGWATAGDGLALAGPRDRSPLELALEALERALLTLDGAGGWHADEAAARLHRKRCFLELRLRRLEAAAVSIQRASALLADHPFHPEQPRLLLAEGRLQLHQGARDAAMAALRSGLELLDQKGAEAGHRDQAALLLELGRAQGEAAQFHGALETLESVRRLAEHEGDRRMLAEALAAQGQVRLGLGQADAALESMLEALLLARSVDDPTLVAECHLGLGMFRSSRQLLGPALSSLERAIRRFEQLGDGPRAAQAQVWKARNLVALGDHGPAELILMRVAGAGTGLLTPVELSERVFLDGEMAEFMDDWSSARRHYQAAANRMANAGLVWRERLARLRCIQAEVQEAEAGAHANLEPAWTRLELLKGPVEGTGSRWLDLEWQKAHALLLSAGGDGRVLTQTLMAWGEVMAGARELRFPAMVLEAGSRSSELLLGQGERLGARARIQDALPSAFELWTKLPEASSGSFLGRNDLHRFQRAADHAGISITWPERVDPLPEWNPTTVDLSLVPPHRANQ